MKTVRLSALLAAPVALLRAAHGLPKATKAMQVVLDQLVAQGGKLGVLFRDSSIALRSAPSYQTIHVPWQCRGIGCV
jgi:hypothetical protein